MTRSYPPTIRTDQGPEYKYCALEQWTFVHGVELRLIQPGKPTQKGFSESYNGRFRNEHEFSDIFMTEKLLMGGVCHAHPFFKRS